ncbi:hypothetical protein ES703_00006 [subsurface metagenome]
MIEVRVFLPRLIIRRVDAKKGILGNTRSEICRHIIINSLTGEKGE